MHPGNILVILQLWLSLARHFDIVLANTIPSSYNMI